MADNSMDLTTASQEDEERRDRLKASLWFAIGKIVDSQTVSLSLNATPQFIGALTEMVWSQIDSSAEDLEKFAKHAGRKVVSTDDVLLLCRRNDALRELVEGEVERAKEGASGKRKRRA